jgi:integrase
MTAKKRKPTRKNTRRARSRRSNRERPSAPYRNGDATRVPVTTPAGNSTPEPSDGGAREVRHDKRFESPLGPAAVQAPANIPILARYIADWLADTVQPNLDPATYAYYEVMARRYIVPALGGTRLDQLQLRDIQTWLDQLATQCQCCAQNKDAARTPSRQRCCAIGDCCEDYPGPRTIQAARNTLRAVLNHAKTSRLISKNVAAFAQVPKPPAHGQRQVWTVTEASRFLDSARSDHDPLYAAYVLILVNGLTKGEVLGITWPSTDLDAGELETGWQLQRIHGELLHRKRTRADGHGGTLPMPDICLTALRSHGEQQDAAREQAGDRWQASDLVFTTRWGTSVDPRNFYRSFQARCAKASVSPIRVRDARRTCPALLAALGVSPEVTARILRHAQVAKPDGAWTETDDHAVAAPKELGDGAHTGPATTERDGS